MLRFFPEATGFLFSQPAFMAENMGRPLAQDNKTSSNPFVRAQLFDPVPGVTQIHDPSRQAWRAAWPSALALSRRRTASCLERTQRARPRPRAASSSLNREGGGERGCCR